MGTPGPFGVANDFSSGSTPLRDRDANGTRIQSTDKKSGGSLIDDTSSKAAAPKRRMTTVVKATNAFSVDG